MRRAAHVDENQPLIVAAVRLIPGVKVKPTHVVGDGFTDLVIGFRGQNFLQEVKPPLFRGIDRRRTELNELEQAWHEEWTGKTDVVRTVLDSYNALGLDGEREIRRREDELVKLARRLCPRIPVAIALRGVQASTRSRP